MATALREEEQTGMGSSDAVVSLAVQNAGSEAGDQTVVAAARSNDRDSQSWVVHGFAAFYLLVITLAWLGLGGRELTNDEFFAQAALVLTSIGLYHATPPKKKG